MYLRSPHRRQSKTSSEYVRLPGLDEVRRLFLQLEQDDATATQKLKAQEQAGRRPRFEEDALGSGMA